MQKKMDSIFFLFLGHCGFQKCITFASKKKFARKSIFEHKAPTQLKVNTNQDIHLDYLYCHKGDYLHKG